MLMDATQALEGRILDESKENRVGDSDGAVEGVFYGEGILGSEFDCLSRAKREFIMNAIRKRIRRHCSSHALRSVEY